MIQRLPESQLTLYAELLDQMIPAAAAAVAEGALAGAFTSKTIKGRIYWYLQRSEGSKVRQIYLGPESPELLGWIERVTHAREVAEPDWTAMRRLGKMLATGGASTEPAAVLKVLKLLADSRVFHLGGVLIGTLAFRSYANSLGVRFQKAALSTSRRNRALGLRSRVKAPPSSSRRSSRAQVSTSTRCRPSTGGNHRPRSRSGGATSGSTSSRP